MSQELALEMLERVEWAPKSVLLTHPVMAEALGKQWQEWEKDRDFMKRYNEVMTRKREQWRDRESHRKLVD